MSRPRPGFADDLHETLAEAWRLLGRGVADRRSGFHHPTLTTIGSDGAPQARTVILRASDPTTRVLRFHTDARSRKAEEIEAEPRVALHFYDPGAKIQLRAAGVATLHRAGTVADASWAGSRTLSRQCYGIAPGPGTRIDAADAFSLPEVDDTETEAGRANFVAVTVAVVRLEWLFLAMGGHRRARFDWTGDTLDASWMTP